tara:strand:- start:1403 stop:2950 length:1548 start_codon:yes stop_codon:yes gene_type:complete
MTHNSLFFRVIRLGRLFTRKIYKLIFRIRNISWFIIDYLKFEKFIKKQKLNKHLKKIDKETVCVTVIPWLGTAIPWYAITIALMLNQKSKNVFILFVDMPFGDDELFHKIQSKLIYKILKQLPIKLIKLSDYNDSGSDSVEIRHLSKLNSLHYVHGETNTELRQSYERIVEKQLALVYSKIESFYKEESFNRIILPGGIWGPSSVISLFAEKNNTQLTTYDSEENIFLMSIFGIAAQLNDIPYFFEKLLNNPKEKLFAIQKGLDQLNNRREGNDLGSHFLEATDTVDFGDDYYLMLLNSVWDTAALGLHTTYDSMIDWILDSTEWVLKNTEKSILIRQHPAERNKHINNTDLYAEKIKNRFGNNKRIKFIHAKDDINTYDLIENAACVLGFSTTIIVESVMLGKPAIIVSCTYYANFGIVYNANNKEEYYMYLQKSSRNELKITQDMKDRACISNYITQTCNYYNTEFTPLRNNYLKWSRLTLEELEKDYLPLQAILKNTPLSTLQHERIFDDNK